MKRFDPKQDPEGEVLSSDLAWGIGAIADHIGRTRRQTQYLIEQRKLPVRRLGKRILVARKSELDAALQAPEA